MGHPYSRYTLPVLTPIASASVADGDYVFPLKGGGPINILEYLTFTPAATAGGVTVQCSPDGGTTWDDMATGGVIIASASSSATRTKPSGRGLATHIKLTLNGVTGATSFSGMFSQAVL